ncbi:hypothetical protein TWF481_011347 [Arthrobotrys musiformis]|uniref:F-box domain-containing protein n=1 Tax=Arthrobotrys musiformis TaxID=47236 RepID=A0AAV9W434_9PEZI
MPANIQTLPSEVHGEISTYLIPQDTACLALSCKSLFRSLGPNNGLLWYRLLSRGAQQVELDSWVSPEIVSWVADISTSYKELDPTGGRNYWAEALEVFSGNDKRPQADEDFFSEGYHSRYVGYRCRLCLRVHVPSGVDRGVIAYRTDEGATVVKKYCQNCLDDWFVRGFDKLKKRYPEIKFPASLAIPPLREGYEEHCFFPIHAVIRCIQEQSRGGVPYEITRKPSNRFIEKWVYKLGDEKEAILLDEAVKFALEVYKKVYKHLLLVISVEELYEILTKFLVQDVLCPSDPEEVFSHNWDGIYAGQYGINAGIGGGIVELSKALSRRDISDSERVAEATNIAVERVISKVLCKPDETQLANDDPKSQFGILAEAMIRALECYTSTHPLSWLRKFSIFYYPYWYSSYADAWASEDPDSYGVAVNLKCYWCLRQGSSEGFAETVSREEDEEDYFEKSNTPEEQGYLSEYWIFTHVFSAHREMLWTRPKRRVYEDYEVIRIGLKSSDGTRYEPEEAPEEVDPDQEEMEEIDPSEVPGYEWEFLTKSTYFIM